MRASWRRRLAALALFTLGCGALVPAGTVVMAKTLGAVTPEVRELVGFGLLLGLGMSCSVSAWWILTGDVDRRKEPR